MSLFRRESLHERLAREGGIPLGEPTPHDTMPRWGEAGIHGLARPREWDETTLVEASQLDGTEAAFTVLPDGTLLVDEEEERDLSLLAGGLGLAPPYRAQAVRRDARWWAVAARRIDVVEVSEDVDGDEIELTVHEGERTLIVDGERAFGSLPSLERLGRERSDSFALHAERLDGPLWEIRLTPL